MHKFARVLFSVLCLAGASQAFSGPQTYYLLAPETFNGDLKVVSLEPANTITVGNYQLTLDQYQRASIPNSVLYSGAAISGTKSFSLGSDPDATDLLVPSQFAGTSFAIPHVAGQHRYYLMTTEPGGATATLTVGASTTNVTLTANTVIEVDGGSDNAQAARITASANIFVAHVGVVSGAVRDAFPVPPAASTVVGIRSQNVTLAASANSTSVTVYASDGTSTPYNLNAGEQVLVTTGVNTAQGQGSALRIDASNPVMAVQHDDGDGNDATAFWPVSLHARRLAIPVDAQYVAVACTSASVSVTLYRGATAPDSQTCSGSATNPGKVYFGSAANGANILAGWYVIASADVYVAYEAATPNDEHNLLGVTLAAGPAAPVLTAPAATTTSNPLAISGTAAANASIRIFVNNKFVATGTANGSGAFTINASLVDGANVIYATALSGSDESAPSSAVTTTYTNSIPRTQTGTIASSAVWTPGSPATPYVISGNLTIAAGATLTLQAGTTLKMANGVALASVGTLRIEGEPGNPVTITCNAATCTKGIWNGIDAITATSNVSISYATIEWAVTGVEVNGGVASVRNSTIRNFSANGVWVQNATASTVIASNYIDNLSDAGDCIETNASSPTISGNTLTNCDNGISVVGNASPTIGGGNVITGNNYGIRVTANGASPQPVATGNQIFSNDTYGFLVSGYAAGAQNLRINATSNWWGTTVASLITPEISDLSDNNTSTTIPVVDFAYFLDSPNGSPIQANYLNGLLSATITTLTAGATYEVLGTLQVPAGKTLNVPAGTTLRFHGVMWLVSYGTLNIQGTSASPVVLTSGRPAPARGNWEGVVIRSNNALIEYAVIEYANNGVNLNEFSATVRNSIIRNFDTNGIWANGAGASASVIQNNLIDNFDDSVDCIETNNASPSITGNTIRNCNYGIHVYQNASPTISGNNIITGNNYGIRLFGNSSQSPQPVITGNQIFANDTYNLQTGSYATGAQNLKINATGNWWGTAVASSITPTIYDLSDSFLSTALPIVDFSGFLDGPAGTPMPGNYLIGQFTAATTTLTAGTTYDVLSGLFVPAGKTLNIPAGTVLRFHGDSYLVSYGTLNIQGTSGSPVVLTSGRAVPARDDWQGVLVRSNNALIEYTVLEYATTVVNLDGFSATVRNSTIRNFDTNGIWVNGAGASASVIQNNLIDNFDDSVDCIETNNASPSITGNTIRNCNYGINVYQNASPTINGNNIITGNNYGLKVYGNSTQNPQPVVTGNQIYGNNTYDYHAQQFQNATNLVLDATGNWWGTTDLRSISNKIFDLTDNYTSPTSYPTVNYASPLDAPNGTPIAGNYMSGRLSANTTLSSATNYSVIGSVFVPVGITLTIQPGATVKFYDAETRLVVDGTLSIQGTAANPVRLTSGSAVLSRNDWRGVLFRSTSVNSVIDFATLEWVYQAVETDNTNVVIRNSIFREYDNGAIRMTAATPASTITNNLIDNVDRTGYGIYLAASSPVISGNRIYRNQYGMYLTGASSPAVSGNAIAFNTYGIYLYGSNSNSSTAVPNPVITANDIFSNVSAQLMLASYGASNPVIVNATGNYWGVSTPVAGQQIARSGSTPAGAVNFSGWSSTPLTGPNAGTIVTSQIYFSPNGDGVKDVTGVSGNLNATANWTVNVRSPSQSIVRSFTGTGTSVSATWDGRDGAGALLPDSAYSIDLQIAASPNPIVLAASTVVIDTVAPTTVITNPAASSSIQNMLTVPVLGTASDPYFTNYFLEYGAGATPSTWTQISTQTTGVVANTLGTWAVNSINGTGGLGAGPYTLRLRTTDRAGNAATVITPLTLNQLILSAITFSNASFKPIVNETTSIGFTLSAPATVALRVFPESGGPLVREITEVFSTAGAKSMVWNGRDGSGAIVPDEAYVLRLFATAGALNAAYDPPTPANTVGSGSGTVDTFYDTRRNDDWSIGYTMAQPGRVRMTVTPSGGAAFYPINWKPYLAGVHNIFWNGRDQLGNVVTGAVNVYFDAPIDLKPGAVITVASALPTVYYYTGSSDFLGNSTLSARPDFVSVIHSYDQQTKFNYFVDQDSWVSIKVLPPGISDPNSTEAVTVKASALVAKDQLDTVTWTGYLPTDTNNIMWGGADGFWTVYLRAQSVATGGVRTLRGSLYMAH